MKPFRKGQGGFAAPAMFIAVIAAFLGSMNVKTDDGTTLASRMGFGQGEQTEFAAIEGGKTQESAAKE